MIAYDDEDDKIKHYRVDKMRDIELVEESRKGNELFSRYDMASYSKMNFAMFGGEETWVKYKVP